MKFLIVLCCSIVAALEIPATLETHRQWSEFKLTHKKTYATPDEERQRFAIFQENLQEIDEHNRLYEQGLVTYKKGVTQFADLTRDEFVNKLSTPRRFEHKQINAESLIAINDPVPDAVDWRSKGVIAPVRDEGQSRNPWAFVVADTVASHIAIETSNLTVLSVQELIDCTGGHYDRIPSSIHDAYDYIRDNGITTESAYRFQDAKLPCRSNDKPIAARIRGYGTVRIINEAALTAQVGLQGPVSVSVNAGDWAFYTGGIFNYNQFPVFYNHAAVIVGYGKQEDGAAYWIVKNTWGAGWGEEGYIRIARLQPYCFIASDATFPIL